MTTPSYPAFIVAARRTAIGRIGGLHRSRRLEDLTAPVILAALADCGLSARDVEEIVIGNASAGGNPARLIALASGLPDRSPAHTIDRQCASGLDAILSAIRLVSAGEARIAVAGGAESLSTAPWRVARPMNAHQLPHFMGLDGFGASRGPSAADTSLVEAAETLARECQIPRQRQDEYALETRRRASEADRAGRFVHEIVALKIRTEEARDEALAHQPSPEAMPELAAYLEPEGTVTPGNSSAMHDCAAIAVIVSAEMLKAMGSPPAIRLVASAAAGVEPGREARAPIDAAQKLRSRLNGSTPKSPFVTELGETTAAQAIAFRDGLGIEDARLNPDGGGLARGHAYGATGAALVARLFTHLVRRRKELGLSHGEAAVGTLGGLGVAALFEAV